MKLFQSSKSYVKSLGISPFGPRYYYQIHLTVGSTLAQCSLHSFVPYCLLLFCSCKESPVLVGNDTEETLCTILHSLPLGSNLLEEELADSLLFAACQSEIPSKTNMSDRLRNIPCYMKSLAPDTWLR